MCDQQKLSPAVCLYPHKPCDHLCVPLSRAETQNCYQLLPKRFGNKIYIVYFPFPFLLCANTRKNTRAYPFAMFDCYRHFSFLHPIQFHTVERIATKSKPHIKRLTDMEAIPFPTSSLFQLTAKFDFPASQNDVKACSKVMYSTKVVPFPVNRPLRFCSCFPLANNTF